ncbi:DUF3718 domain-containing protein [Shewanella sp. 3B26]|uniref:DUF3718 domain-containing protein n=1 Tax=Shewanella zhuhaiensis TaxID=2919576 RepID=A0AAJ1BF89_9GAMM|nr:DUF3718 domain-containing protein [Shewanella zhuhaiensis]MCH4293548.1 DUF3718 domain-containing protein [Shewanella zhuhaiensis]
MKTQHVLTALALATACFGASAAMSPSVENALIAVCKAGMSNNMVRFYDTMKDYRINEQRVFPRLVCNGESFHEFALSHGADRTAKRIAHYLPGQVTIKDLTMTGADERIYVSFTE